MSHTDLIMYSANKESLPEVTGLKESSFLIVFFDGMKVVIWLRIERVQRIIAIQGVSLVRILNHPSLDRLVGRDSKYPLTQSVGRENLSGCHLAPRGLRPLGARWHPSRFSLPLSFVCGYSRISPFLTLSFGEDLWILTRSPPSITLISATSRVRQR